MSRGKVLFITCLSLIIIGLLFFSAMPVFASGHSSLHEARTALEQQLKKVSGFAGIAHSEKDGTITVFVENEGVKGIAPDSFEGFPVQKVVTGRLEATDPQVSATTLPYAVTQQVSRTGVVRPLVGGISLSAYNSAWSTIYAGTLGMITYGSTHYILSCAHVIAMNPDTSYFLTSPTPVIQPGSIDGGKLINQVGTAGTSYIPIIFNNNSAQNQADAAIASLSSSVQGTSGAQFLAASRSSSSGYTTYTVSGPSQTVSPGQTVRKSGRTTGVTTGTVSYTNATVQVYYTSSEWAMFTNQIVVIKPLWQAFSQAGDSGSCVDDGHGHFVGLVFAGANSRTQSTSVICPAGPINSGLGINGGK